MMHVCHALGLTPPPSHQPPAPGSCLPPPLGLTPAACLLPVHPQLALEGPSAGLVFRSDADTPKWAMQLNSDDLELISQVQPHEERRRLSGEDFVVGQQVFELGGQPRKAVVFKGDTAGVELQGGLSASTVRRGAHGWAGCPPC